MLEYQSLQTVHLLIDSLITNHKITIYGEFKSITDIGYYSDSAIYRVAQNDAWNWYYNSGMLCFQTKKFLRIHI